MELARLRGGWLRVAKGRLTFEGVGARQMPVSACTLRRARHGRLPTLHTIRVFARGTNADEKKAREMWAAAVHPEPVWKPAAYVPGHQIATQAGLALAGAAGVGTGAMGS